MSRIRPDDADRRWAIGRKIRPFCINPSTGAYVVLDTSKNITLAPEELRMTRNHERNREVLANPLTYEHARTIANRYRR